MYQDKVVKADEFGKKTTLICYIYLMIIIIAKILLKTNVSWMGAFEALILLRRERRSFNLVLLTSFWEYMLDM